MTAGEGVEYVRSMLLANVATNATSVRKCRTEGERPVLCTISGLRRMCSRTGMHLQPPVRPRQRSGFGDFLQTPPGRDRGRSSGLRLKTKPPGCDIRCRGEFVLFHLVPYPHITSETAPSLVPAIVHRWLGAVRGKPR